MGIHNASRSSSAPNSDPLLVGELNGDGEQKYFLIDQFDLTGAEQYLIDEFALRMNPELC